jgi:hypothetical protein
MGVFDNESNRKFNDAKPNYSEDGVDIVDCDKECIYKDISKNRCTFETCIIKQHPFNINHHKHTTTKCIICEDNIDVEFDDFNIPFGIAAVSLINPICDKCKKKIRRL